MSNGNVSAQEQTAEQAIERASLRRGQAVPVRRLVLAGVVTLAGFAAAILSNRLIPQVAQGLKDAQYALGPLTLDRNGFYRLVLLALMIIYALKGVEAYFTPRKRTHYVKQAAFRCALGIALALFDLLGTKLQATPQPFFPGLAQILKSFLMEGAYIGTNVLYSLRLFGAGFALGVGTGVMIGWFHKVYYWVYPVRKITGVIPAVAWMPFALTLFPTPFAAAVFLIVISSWFTVASQTSFGIQTTPRSQFEAARTLGGSTPYLVFHVAVPHAMPQIFNGVTTACASSFTCLVIAEMMGQPGGLGYYINVAKVWAAYYKIFAAILIMAVLFSLIQAILGAVRGYVLRWQRGQSK
ncbi:MAG: ABC transporter permease subunit [Candidatus Spyradocola sp.]|nr:ABC transporter permease subunit [Candidatus Spyradocola sp.]